MRPKDSNPSPKIDFNPKASLTDEARLRIIADVSADAIYDWDIEAGVTRWTDPIAVVRMKIDYCI